VRQAVGFAVSPPLRDLAKLPRAPQYGVHEALPVRRIPKRDFGIAVDPVEQNTARPQPNFTTGLNLLGVGNGFPGYTVPDAPPDTNMAVGDTQIVQWVNVSFAVFNKFNGATLAGPIDGNLLFTALGGPCASSNSGDIIAQWDNAAHQWFLAQNVFSGPPYYACVAISTSADALGTYYLYQFPLGNGFPDYPKWGRWNTSWAQTMNNFGPSGSGFVGPEVCVYNRTKLLLGQSGPPAIQVCFQLAPDGDSLLPADIDSATRPPAAEDQFFIGSLGDVNNSHLSLYSVHIDWLHPSGATITGNHNSQLITVPTYTGSCSGSFGGDCVPQKGTTALLDSLGDRLMYRFAYYNDPTGGKQHWYVNHDVEASAGQIGVRWYEFQAPQISIPPLGLTLFQADTYAPADSNYRWMGSVAADMNNDILAGYSESSSSMYPSIEVAGRLKSDPPSTLESEVSVVAGTGSQPDTANRWGDYSAMRLDPDGCTFWYTTEYYMATQPFDWSTRIANIKFTGCQNPAYDGYLELCKQADPDYPPLPMLFSFTLTAPFFSMGPIVVPVGSCSPPIQVPSGIVTITEAPQVGVAVENVTAYSYDQFGNYIDELDSWTPPEQTATVTVMPGGVNLETVATFTNYAAPPGTLKICKIAGSGVTVGTPFTFTASDGTIQHRDIVNAGPGPGGNCVIDGTWPVNDPVTVTEIIPPGVSVSSITVEPPDRGGPPNLSGGYVTVTIGSGFTEVDFTDIVSVVQGSCLPSESLSVLLTSGGNVTAYVPQGAWLRPGTGVYVANIEGSYIQNSPVSVSTADTINSCASDPSPGYLQTVCTANNNDIIVIEGNNPPMVTHTVTSDPSVKGLIRFSGGCCTNCGIAMNASKHQAVIGASLNGSNADTCTDGNPPGYTGQAGYQFIALNSGGAPTVGSTYLSQAMGGTTHAHISEDILWDPVNNLVLSPGDCAFGYDPSCSNPDYTPTYEIAKITYLNGVPTPAFYENQIGRPMGMGDLDSAAEDCSATIALSSLEGVNPSKPFIADLNQACFPNQPGCNVPAGTWTDPLYSMFQPLLNSTLNINNGSSGPIAVAQGGSHIGVMGQETFSSSGVNTITAFRIDVPPYSSLNPFGIGDWVTCNLGSYGNPAKQFVQGADPHTVTAYQSPGTNPIFTKGDAIAVLANTPPASELAVVDLTKMLSLKRDSTGTLCAGGVTNGTPGTLSYPVVTFVKLH
jgi:hypothetical protein